MSGMKTPHVMSDKVAGPVRTILMVISVQIEHNKYLALFRTTEYRICIYVCRETHFTNQVA